MTRGLALMGSLAIAAPAAAADTTVTRTVTPGGTFRSAEGPPTAENPLIVSGTIRPCGTGNNPPCPTGGPVTLTMTFHDTGGADFNEENFEGDTWELAPAGPWVDISLSTDDVSVDSITLDVDRSQLYPGFTGLVAPGTDLKGRGGPQLGFLAGNAGTAPKPNQTNGLSAFGCADHCINGAKPDTYEKLADGDLRVSRRAVDDETGSAFGMGQNASFVPVQPWGVAKLLGTFAIRAELTEALNKGVLVVPRSYYKCDLTVKLTVSSAVAKQLKLRSTTIGEDELGPRCGGRVPLKAAVKRKLRRYSKVVGKATVTSRNADGTKTVSSARLELKKAERESELE